MQSLDRPIGLTRSGLFLAAGIVAGGLWLLGAWTPASAQFGPSVAATEAMNATGGGAGPAPGTVQRAAAAVAPVPPAPAAPAASGAMMPPVGFNPAAIAVAPAQAPAAPAMSGAMMPPVGTLPGGAAAQAGVPAANLPPLPSLTVLTKDAMVGQQVIDAFSYRRKPNDPLILDDIRRIQIKESDKSKYSDDGQTLGDWKAKDDLYSNIQPKSTNDFIGDVSFFNLQRIDQLLQAAQAMDPLDFFGLTALTTERFSLVAGLRDRIRQRDNKIMNVNADGAFTGWAEKFLRDYRVQSDNPNSPFFPLYVPRPPDPPALPTPPAPWKPMAGRNPALETAITAYLAGLAVTVDKATEEANVRQRLTSDPAALRAFIAQNTPAIVGAIPGGPGQRQGPGAQPPQRRGGGGGGGGGTSGAVRPPGR